MQWIAALALNAINPQLTKNNDIFCDLAPYIGQGSSQGGRLNSLTGLKLGCAMPLIQAKEWTLGPRLEFAEQHWSIYQNLGTQTQFTNFQARTLGFGLQTFYILDETWTVSYSLSYNLGNGSQDQNTSTSNSAQNLKFTQVSQRGFSHQLAFEKRLSTRLSFLTGLQFDQFRQSWDSSRGQVTEETVAPGNKLTLTSGVATDIRQPLRDHDGYKSYSLRLGLSLLMN